VSSAPASCRQRLLARSQEFRDVAARAPFSSKHQLFERGRGADETWLSSRAKRGICFSLTLEADPVLFGVARAARARSRSSRPRSKIVRWPRGTGARVKRARLQISFCERQRADPSSLCSSG